MRRSRRWACGPWSGSTSCRSRATQHCATGPGVYGAYLAADLGALAPDEERLIRDAAPNTLACVGSVGGGHLPAGAVAAALELLAPDALVTHA